MRVRVKSTTSSEGIGGSEGTDGPFEGRDGGGMEELVLGGMFRRRQSRLTTADANG